VDRELGGLVLPPDFEIDEAPGELIVLTRAGADVELKGHPLARGVADTVSGGRKVGRALLAIEAIGGRSSVLELEIERGKGLLEGIVGPMGRRARTGVVELGEAALTRILGDDLQRAAGVE
jgi:hypothetical protein